MKSQPREISINLAVTLAMSAALAMGLQNAEGVLMTSYQFSGRIDTVTDPSGDWVGLVAPGVPFSGTYTYDPTVPDSVPDNPSIGIYTSADSSFSINVGNWTGATSGDRCEISVYNSIGWDSGFVISAVGFQSSGRSISEMTVGLSRTNGSAFESDALPTVAPSFDVFPYRAFGFQAANYVRIVGTLESLVLTPEPSTLLLWLFSAGFISCLRRSNERCR
ncbi:MAG: hypothetical protein HY718_05695 [Planctomycetes bacterium]|nr:hypothetical protein [Planctomycetota bacterium]